MQLIALLSLALGLPAFADGGPSQWVNPLLGSGGNPVSSGNTFPGVSLPFGEIRLSPDTRFPPGLFRWWATARNGGKAGYFYGHTRLLGFSHTRWEGGGVREGGLFRVLPLRHEERTDPSRRPGETAFRHEQETASPGFYALSLPHEGVRAELTSTLRCGVHRYLKLGKNDVDVWLNLTSSLSNGKTGMKATISQDPSSRVLQGRTDLRSDFSGQYGGLPTYFYAEYSDGFADTRLLAGSSWSSERSAEGEGAGARFLLSGESAAGELRICISHVSGANARAAFEHEVRGLTFDEIRARAVQAWDSMLGRIEIEAPSVDFQRTFYSLLRNTMLMPTLFTDVNGDYLGFDRQVHRAEGFAYRTDFSLWDTFRTAHPLYTLIAPEIQRDSVLSLLEMGRIEGRLPQLPSGIAETNCMFGAPANFLFAESYLKGIRDFDAGLALDLMAREGRQRRFSSMNYLPADLVRDGSVSQTLEYAWADAATAELGRALGKSDVAREFDEKALAFRNIWDAKRRYFGPKTSKGEFFDYATDLNTFFFGKSLVPGGLHFVEGSAFQYRFSAPQRPRELIALFGGQGPFVEALESFMKGASVQRDAFYPGGQYWHGNEPDLHAIYLFNEAGRPELTQKWVRWALTTRYANTPAGLDGNDDSGTLSAWYILSSLGLYPQPGTDRYWLGAPMVRSARLDLGEGRVLKIVAHDQALKSPYVQRVLLNGEPLCRPEVSHRQLINGTLEFQMGPKAADGGGYPPCATSKR